VGYLAPGDSNSYVVHERSRRGNLVLEVFASSGPGATVSGGSIEKKRASVETVAGYYAQDYGCDSPRKFSGVVADKTTFDASRNTWTVRVSCK
jgi:hypothetical protein